MVASLKISSLYVAINLALFPFSFWGRVGSAGGGGSTPTPTPPGGVSAPVFSPVGGTFAFHPSVITVTLTTSTSGAKMRYTTNGSTPTATSGTLINSTSGTVSIPRNSDVVLQAVAFVTGASSTVTSSEYVNCDAACS